jgi:hypothetical protein
MQSRIATAVQPAIDAASGQRTTDTGPSTRLRGRWLVLARIAWVVLVLPIFWLYGVDLWQQSSMLVTVNGWITFGAWNVLLPLGFVLCAALLIWHRSDDWMGLLVSFALISLGVYLLTGINLEVSALPGWRWVNLVLATLGGYAFFLLLYLFPDGRFVPRWGPWLVLGCALVGSGWDVSWLLREDGQVALGVSTAPVVFVVGLAAQVYRYRRVSDSLQRQQTRWVLAGLVGPIIVVVVFFAFLNDPTLSDREWVGVELLIRPLSVLLDLCWPVSIVIAILRYRLWDIDRLINRALVYGTLTALLALVYFCSVVLLQQLLGPLLGQGNDLAIIASTLTIAALFQPLRRRIQAGIDRRFYRRKYDAVKIVQAFGTRLRDEVDLNTVSDDLLAVVEETLQPVHVSLWLRAGRPERGISKFEER